MVEMKSKIQRRTLTTRPHPPLATALRAHGYADDPERFRELLMDLFAAMYRESTVDELLADELEPRVFVAEVRARSGCHSLPHDLVLRTLLNMRKKG